MTHRRDTPWSERDLRAECSVGLYVALVSLERDRDPGAAPDLWAMRAVLRMTDRRGVRKAA